MAVFNRNERQIVNFQYRRLSIVTDCQLVNFADVKSDTTFSEGVVELWFGISYFLSLENVLRDFSTMDLEY